MTFALIAAHAWRERKRDGARDVWRLASALVFAFLFEDVNVRALTGRGSYFYHPDFWLWLDRVPVFIVASWSIILWSAMRLSQARPAPMWALVARDALLAVLLDLAFDAVAIRHELWTWRGFGSQQAWFGVPAGNFFGWLWVSLAFSALTRAREAKPSGFRPLIALLGVPLGALALYKIAETLTNWLLHALGVSSDVNALQAFGLMLLLVVAFAHCDERDKTERAPLLAFAVRAAFHAFAFFGVWLLPATATVKSQRPAIFGVALLLVAWEIWDARRHFMARFQS